MGANRGRRPKRTGLRQPGTATLDTDAGHAGSGPSARKKSRSSSKTEEDIDEHPPSGAPSASGESAPVNGARHGAAESVLQNELILPRIAMPLPPKDLRRLRQTCALWKHSFVSVLKETDNEDRARVQLLGLPWRPNEPMRPCMMMNEYTRLVRSSLDIPYTSYTLCDSTMTRHQEFKDFFEVCGDSIRNLQLEVLHERDQLSNLGKTRQIVFELTPNLRSLVFVLEGGKEPIWNKRQKTALVKEIPHLLSLQFGIREGAHPAFRTLLRDILKSAPELEALLTNPRGCHDGNRNASRL